MCLSEKLSTIIFVLLLFLSFTDGKQDSAKSQQQHLLHRNITLKNNADTAVDVAWIHPDTGTEISMGPSINVGEAILFDSFVNHTFIVHEHTDTAPSAMASSEIQYLPTSHLSDDTDEINASIGESSYITVSSDEGEQVVVIQKGLQLERTLAIDSAVESTIKEKNQDVQSMMEACRKQSPSGDESNLMEMIQCMERKTAEKLIILNEELAFQRDLRRNIASMNENYTCTDATRNTTTPKRTTTWSSQEGNDEHPSIIIRNVGIVHEHRASQIHVIENFISREECDAIQNAAEPLLHRGTVADGKGGSTMSQNRKAWQAGISIKGDPYNINDPIANVKRRLFAYTNHAVGYNLTLDGQEDIMSIQYFGLNSTGRKGKESENDILSSPDQYTPHCDGDCNNLFHKNGSRVATMVMYCDVPVSGGGGTNFQQANVYVKPKFGVAAFFSYMDPITLIHDEGFTTHSGCPVLYGTKRIAVQWMRYGVDNDNPWDSFDTNNIKMK
jgi:hypothetical protein